MDFTIRAYQRGALWGCTGTSAAVEFTIPPVHASQSDAEDAAILWVKRWNADIEPEEVPVFADSRVVDGSELPDPAPARDGIPAS